MSENLFTFLAQVSMASESSHTYLPATVKIAGRDIALFFSHRQLYQEYFPALAHQQIESTKDLRLTVTICDNRSHPLPPEVQKIVLDELHNPEEAEAPVTVRHSETQILSCHFDRGSLAALYYYDRSTQRACAWVNGALEAAESMSVSAPIRAILSWFFTTEGFTLLHAGGVARCGAGGVLFCGQSGSGKSSCSLISIDDEVGIAGDDSVLVTKSPSPTVHSLYCSARIAPADSAHYSFLKNATVGRSAIKSNFYLGGKSGGPMISSFRLNALIFPHISAQQCPAIAPLSKIEALRMLSASSLYHVPGRDVSDLFTTLSQLVSGTPCFRLSLGRDREGVRHLIRHLMTSGVVSIA